MERWTLSKRDEITNITHVTSVVFDHVCVNCCLGVSGQPVAYRERCLVASYLRNHAYFM